MAKEPKEKLPKSLFMVSLPTLHSLRFRNARATDGHGEGAEDTPTLNLENSISRLGRAQLGYELKVGVEFDGTSLIEAAYRAVFVIEEEGDESEVEEQLRRIAAHNAPALLYPYVRECIHSTLQRATPGPLTLPVVSFAHVWDPAEIELPPFEGEAEEDEEE